mgnify:FL=1|tara:strand:- start:1436 stop:1999 length:564 start_codon:yes stop_codon:yes gene_type:complete
MRLILLFTLLILSNCTKPKTVLICGNHVCVNKSEANQYFEENLTIEVKLIDKKKINKPNLIQLNLSHNEEGNKKINAYSKETTSKNLKTLSNIEIDKIKKNIKNKKNKEKILKKVIKSKKRNNILKEVKEKKIKDKKIKITYKNLYKDKTNSIDICTIVKNCNIDEISKYLLKQGRKNKFPDITTRQ